MDIYKLINSNAVRNYCREIKHKFNTIEIAVLIYRNKKMNIYDKIVAYAELLKKYDDMEIAETFTCRHYGSVKDLIKQEIQRLQTLDGEIQQSGNDTIYTYTPYYKSASKYEHTEFDNTYRTYTDVSNAVEKDIVEYDDISKYKISKRVLNQDKPKITAEFIVENGVSKMIDINSSPSEFLDLDGIFINIPTPFEKGDLLEYEGKIFVLDWLITWRDDLQTAMEKGPLDSSDMGGNGYYVSENNKIFLKHVFDFDSWEYFRGKLTGKQRLLKSISSLMKNKINLELFLTAYEGIKADENKRWLHNYTAENLKLAGLNDEDINKK